jgi:hypothetical protein
LFQGSTEFTKRAGSKLEICALGHPVRHWSCLFEGTAPYAEGGAASSVAGAPARNNLLVIMFLR